MWRCSSKAVSRSVSNTVLVPVSLRELPDPRPAGSLLPKPKCSLLAASNGVSSPCLVNWVSGPFGLASSAPCSFGLCEQLLGKLLVTHVDRHRIGVLASLVFPAKLIPGVSDQDHYSVLRQTLGALVRLGIRVYQLRGMNRGEPAAWVTWLVFSVDWKFVRH